MCQVFLKEIIMQDFIDWTVTLLILGGIVYGLATIGFWFAFGIAVLYAWMRLGDF
jgi:hypothetical protein